VGVTGVVVMFLWIGRRIQPLQKQARFGFDYLGVLDHSRFSVELIQQSDAVDRVSWALMGTEIVPYVSKMYSTKDPPKHVSIHILLYFNNILSDINSSDTFVAAGCGCIQKYAAMPDITHPRHL
jgi:hypothetical protein